MIDKPVKVKMHMCFGRAQLKSVLKGFACCQCSDLCAFFYSCSCAWIVLVSWISLRLTCALQLICSIYCSKIQNQGTIYSPQAQFMGQSRKGSQWLNVLLIQQKRHAEQTTGWYLEADLTSWGCDLVWNLASQHSILRNKKWWPIFSSEVEACPKQ